MPHRSNRLLDGLSPETQQLLQPLLRPVDLHAGAELSAASAAPSHVYFLLSGFASVVVSVPDGGCAEVGMVGVDGLVGAIHLLGSKSPVDRCFMQSSGAALRMSLQDARRVFQESPEFRAGVLQFVQADALLTRQLAACNKLHQAAERTARWLLTAADRSGSDTLALTQEGLAQMLGTRRTTVALVAGEMQRTGLLRYRRGLVRIANRDALAALACDCYGVTRRILDNA